MKKEEKENYIPEICKVKHESIDKDIENIKDDIKEIKEKGEEDFGRLRKMMTLIMKEVKDSHDNLKNKIILSEKRTGDKIDKLNEFDDSLKGNGNPGIWETIRSIKKTLRIIVVILILLLGGSFLGVTLEKIKGTFGMNNTTAEIVKPIEGIKPSYKLRGEIK